MALLEYSTLKFAPGARLECAFILQDLLHGGIERLGLGDVVRQPSGALQGDGGLAVRG